MNSKSNQYTYKTIYYLISVIIVLSIAWTHHSAVAADKTEEPAAPVIKEEVAPSKQAPTEPTATKSDDQQLKQPFAPPTRLSFGNYLSSRVAESAGDTKNGIFFLRESLKQDPNNKELLGSLYRALILSGKLDEVFPLASKLAGIRVVEEGSEFLPEMVVAIDEAKQGNYENALKRIQGVKATGFNTLMVPLMEAWLKLGNKEIIKPLVAAEMIPGAKVILPQIYLHVAYINELAGFEPEARVAYESAAKDSPTLPFRAIEALSNFYARKGLLKEQKAVIEAYLVKHNESFLTDELLLKSGNASIEALVRDPRDGIAETLYTMASVFHGVRVASEEAALLQLALYVRPDFPIAQFLLANDYEMMQNYAAAIATYGSINKHSPYYIRGKIRSAFDQNEMGQKEAALDELNKLIADMPDTIDALIAKADLLRGDNRCVEAIANYQTALDSVKKSDKKYWVLYFARAVCHDKLGKWELAETDLKKALELSPNQPDVLNFLGYSWLIMKKNIPEAKKMIETAYEARPEDGPIIDSMGYALYMNGDYTSALEYFEQALERTPDDATVNEHLGDTYWQLNRKVEARYQWEKALASKPEPVNEKALRKKLESGLDTDPSSAPATKSETRQTTETTEE